MFRLAGIPVSPLLPSAGSVRAAREGGLKLAADDVERSFHEHGINAFVVEWPPSRVDGTDPMRRTNVRKDINNEKMATPRLITGMLFLLLLLPFLPRPPASFAGDRSREGAICDAQAGGISSGQTVTKEVPHSSDSVSDLKEREAGKPPPPRGNVAIPTHRILLGDNVAVPPVPDGGSERNRTP